MGLELAIQGRNSGDGVRSQLLPLLFTESARDTGDGIETKVPGEGVRGTEHEDLEAAGTCMPNATGVCAPTCKESAGLLAQTF